MLIKMYVTFLLMILTYNLPTSLCGEMSAACTLSSFGTDHRMFCCSMPELMCSSARVLSNAKYLMSTVKGSKSVCTNFNNLYYCCASIESPQGVCYPFNYKEGENCENEEPCNFEGRYICCKMENNKRCSSFRRQFQYTPLLDEASCFFETDSQFCCPEENSTWCTVVSKSHGGLWPPPYVTYERPNAGGNVYAPPRGGNVLTPPRGGNVYAPPRNLIMRPTQNEQMTAQVMNFNEKFDRDMLKTFRDNRGLPVSLNMTDNEVVINTPPPQLDLEESQKSEIILETTEIPQEDFTLEENLKPKFETDSEIEETTPLPNFDDSTENRLWKPSNSDESDTNSLTDLRSLKNDSENIITEGMKEIVTSQDQLTEDVKEISEDSRFQEILEPATEINENVEITTDSNESIEEKSSTTATNNLGGNDRKRIFGAKRMGRRGTSMLRVIGHPVRRATLTLKQDRGSDLVNVRITNMIPGVVTLFIGASSACGYVTDEGNEFSTLDVGASGKGETVVELEADLRDIKGHPIFLTSRDKVVACGNLIVV